MSDCIHNTNFIVTYTHYNCNFSLFCHGIQLISLIPIVYDVAEASYYLTNTKTDNERYQIPLPKQNTSLSPSSFGLLYNKVSWLYAWHQYSFISLRGNIMGTCSSSYYLWRNIYIFNFHITSHLNKFFRNLSFTLTNHNFPTLSFKFL